MSTTADEENDGKWKPTRNKRTNKYKSKLKLSVMAPAEIAMLRQSTVDRLQAVIDRQLAPYPQAQRDDFLSLNAARNIEISVYNSVVCKSVEKNRARRWQNPRFKTTYMLKADDVLVNLDVSSAVQNTYLFDSLVTRRLLPHEVGFLRPQDMFPERWEAIIHEHRLKHESQQSHDASAFSTEFECPRCKQRKCSYAEVQTRSADEPMTIFVTCMNAKCKHQWRM